MSRLSIRARLALAFAAALLLVLVAAGAFVYLRVDETLTSGLDERLETQLGELAALAAEEDDLGEEGALPGPRDPEDGFSQILAADGRALASSLPEGEGAVVDPNALPGEPEERPVAGVDGDARIVAVEVDRGRIVVAGASTDDRAEALAGIASAFAIGAPVAMLLASGLGYLLAARSMAPVEAIRRRAGEITLARDGERLPLPRSEDEIHRLATTLNAMLDRIEASFEREREFVADASHELRTPLAVLRTELELAQRPGRDREEMRAALRSAEAETQRLSRLAEDLLLIARSDEGGLPLKVEPSEIGPLVERVCGRFEPRAREEGREIRAECEAGLVARLDPFRVEQCLGNLVDNALAHGAGTVTVAANGAGEGVRFEVLDEGAGFPPGFEERAFERFTRADPGRTGGGAGLGLAIVRAVAEAHGGSARIASSTSHPASVEIVL
jgi:two-component system OmpR family sensor kinase